MLFGEHNAHLHQIEDTLGVHIATRGNTISLSGAEQAVKTAQGVITQLWDKLERTRNLASGEVDAALRFVRKNGHAQADTTDPIKTARSQDIAPRSPNQAAYIDAMRTHEMVFGIGPAGTGKTYLAVALAVSMYKEGLIDRLVFCRPAVEAGENLGFLPGDMQEKIDPYLRPIYDALHDSMPGDQIAKKVANGDIEIAPLAFMRGRTLKNAFVILDEAQNTTSMQMKMFLTRMGEGTRMVITGDPSQVDLKPGIQSGLHEARNILRNVEGVAFVEFGTEDVIRHKMVGRIVKAYEEHKR